MFSPLTTQNHFWINSISGVRKIEIVSFFPLCAYSTNPLARWQQIKGKPRKNTAAGWISGGLRINMTIFSRWGGFSFPLRIHPCVLNGKPRLLRHILQQLILLNLNIGFFFSQRLNFIATLPASLWRFSCFFPSQYNIKRCLSNMMNALSICQGSGTLFLTNIRKGNQIKNWREKRKSMCERGAVAL